MKKREQGDFLFSLSLSLSDWREPLSGWLGDARWSLKRRAVAGAALGLMGLFGLAVVEGKKKIKKGRARKGGNRRARDQQGRFWG